MTSLNILSNENYTGNSVFGWTMVAEYPAVKRIKNQPEEIHRSENHHPPLIDRETFNRVQEMKKRRSNMTDDEHGNKVRKSTHYSMKRSDNKDEGPTEKV